MDYLTEEQAIDLAAESNYTELFKQDGYWWGFPSNGVMPVQIGRARLGFPAVSVTVTNGDRASLEAAIDSAINDAVRDRRPISPNSIRELHRMIMSADLRVQDCDPTSAQVDWAALNCIANYLDERPPELLQDSTQKDS